MDSVRFEGFSPRLFRFFRGLAGNNTRDWFGRNRSEYEGQVLRPIKDLVREIGPLLRLLDPNLETEPRVGKTLSRISNGSHRNRPPYRTFIYVTFPRKGIEGHHAALLYVGIYSHGVAAGLRPSGARELRAGPVQEAIRRNPRMFQRYLNSRFIAERYSELVGGENGQVAKWPVPKTARRWFQVESFAVGDYFRASEPIVYRRDFLNRIGQILLDLYPLWLFTMSSDLRSDLESYYENVRLLSGCLTQAAD